MYYEENELPDRKIESILGKPVKEWIRGSDPFFIKYFKIISDLKINSLTGYKGIFELYDGGLLLRAFKSDKRILIPIELAGIEYIKIQKGQEIIDPSPLYPMWILMKLGLSIEKARYFQIFGYEYSIQETLINIKSQLFEMKLGSNGYSFKGHEKFFLRLRLNDKLMIVKPAPRHKK